MTPNFFSMKLLRFTYLGPFCLRRRRKFLTPPSQNTSENAFPRWGNVLQKGGLLLEVYFMRMVRPAVRLALLEGEMCIFIKYLLEYLALSTSIRRFAVDNFWQTSVRRA